MGRRASRERGGDERSFLRDSAPEPLKINILRWFRGAWPHHGSPQRATVRSGNIMANTLIHESRRLLLPFDTVVDALIELDVKHGRWPAGAQLAEVSTVDGEDESARGVVMSIRVPGKTEVAQRTYLLPIIAAAIVNYCLAMRVPMPRSSTKTIQIVPEGIALQLENTLMLQRRHVEPPSIRVVTAQPAPGGASADAADNPPAATEAAEPAGSIAELRAGGDGQTEGDAQ